MNIIAFDCHYLCYRAFHSLNKEDPHTRVGLLPSLFLRDVDGIIDRFGADQLLFAFDSSANLRAEICSQYKTSRHAPKDNDTEEEVLARQLLKDMMVKLKKEILPNLGYANVLSFRGYEADDIIAKACRDKPDNDNVVVITADKDLLQCLQWPNVSWYSPGTRQIITADHFRKEKGIDPKDYWVVKCLTGCSSDDVPGIYGVGDGFAIKYLTGKLTKGKIFEKLEVQGQEYIQRNEVLVKIPFEGTPDFELGFDDIDETSKAEIMGKVTTRPKKGRLEGFAP